MKKQPKRKTLLNAPDNDDEKPEFIDGEKKSKHPPVEEPLNSPFEVIPGLTLSKVRALQEKQKTFGGGGGESGRSKTVLQDNLMTKENYKNMFKNLNLSDGSIIL